MIHHLATAFVDFLVAVFALSSKQATASRPMALVALSMGFWSLELFVLSSVDDLSYLYPLFHLTRWGMFLIPPSLTLLTWRLIGRNSKHFFYFAVCPGFVLSILLCISNFFFMRSSLEQVTGGYQPEPDVIYALFSASFVASLLACIGLGFKRFRGATYREAQKIKWLLIVLAATLMLGIISMLLIRYPFYLKLVGASINIVFIGLLFYATVQHHLMDVKLALSVGLVKATAVAVILWSYFFVGAFMGAPMDTTSHIVVMVIFIYITLELYPLYREWALSKTKKIVSLRPYDSKKLQQNVRLMLDASFDKATFGHVLDYVFVENMKLTSYCLLSVDLSNRTLNQDVEMGGEKFKGGSEVIDELLISNSIANQGFILTDECSGVIRDSMEFNALSGLFGVMNNDSLVAIVLLGKPIGDDYYHYDDMILVDWLIKDLGAVISRLHKLNEVYDDLSDAKKTLSLLSMMNQYHHDIKAPLSIIDGVISNNVYDEEKQREIVLGQVARMTKLVATMSSVFQEQRVRKERPVDLASLVKDCVVMFERQIFRVVYDLNCVPPVFGDEDDLKILFINLIKNGIEAADQSKSIIYVGSWEENNNTCISIGDNGVGIEEERLSSIFRRSHTTKPNGSGIGMQAIKRIADEHGASVEVNSILNKGSTFIIRFPVVSTRLAGEA